MKTTNKQKISPSASRIGVFSIRKNEIDVKRKEMLDRMREKESFRVATGWGTWNKGNFTAGKFHWPNYEQFNAAYNLREILSDEIVFEIDSDHASLVDQAVKEFCKNIKEAKIKFEYWEFEKGRSPHIHIKDLDIPESISKDKKHLKLFKQAFIKTYCPEKYWKYVDWSLCGCHLVAIENQHHWKRGTLKKLKGGNTFGIPRYTKVYPLDKI